METHLLNTLLEVRFFGIKLINPEDFLELIFRFMLNLGIVILIARYIYYPIAKRKDFLFSYILISIIVFLLCFLLSNVKLGLGFALGLFAIFGIIRYRTDSIPIKEMTYLFIVIGVSVINALINKKVSWAELILTDLSVIIVTYALEKVWLMRTESSRLIIYEKIEMIKPENHGRLLQDLKDRTGLNVHRFHIERVDFLRDVARIFIYYYDDSKK